LLDTYNQIWNKVMLRCPAASSLLARDWVQNAFRQVAERRRWSWLIKFGQFIAPPLVNQGRVLLTQGLTTVTGLGTEWDESMITRQFRSGNPNPIYTITQVNSSESLELDSPWGGQSSRFPEPYEIYRCYFTPPHDFQSLMNVWDPRMNWRLWMHIQQEELNTWDAQRANRGQAYVVAQLDYTRDYVGTISPVHQVRGAGSRPIRTDGSIYTGPTPAVFSIEIVLGGFVGTAGVAEYMWGKNGPAVNGPIEVDSSPQYLQDGVAIFWPEDGAFSFGDVFTINASPISVPGLPRYEIWPHIVGPYIYPFFYIARAADLSDINAVLPRYIRGDCLLELALAEAARWPGPAADRPNPYFNMQLAAMHQARAEKMLLELERQDDETYEQDVTFKQTLGFPMATPFGDASWLQSQAV